jgi:AraC-like DNA-binding protein
MMTGAPDVFPLEEHLTALQVRLIVSRRERIDSTWNRQVFCSPFWRLYVNNRSGAQIETQRGPWRLTARRPHLLPAWMPFQTRLPDAGTDFRQSFLHFEVPGLPPTLQRRLFDRPLRLDAAGPVGALCRRWLADLDGDAPPPAAWAWAQALAQAAFAAALGALAPSARTECLGWLERSGDLGTVLNEIDRRLANPPSNAELAALRHLSPDHFIRVFRRSLGVTPAQYILDRRLTAAATWLAQTRRTVDDIAEAAGFTDRFHFSRAFKSRLGISPVAYRRIHRSPAPGSGVATGRF